MDPNLLSRYCNNLYILFLYIIYIYIIYMLFLCERLWNLRNNYYIT